MELLPDFPALSRWFQAASLLTSREVANLQEHWGQSIRGRHVLEAMRALRERLRKQIFSWEGCGTVHLSTVDELNRLMAEHPMRSRMIEKGRAPSTELWFEPHKPNDLFAPLAHSAAVLFTNVDRNRVRKCDQCVLPKRAPGAGAACNCAETASRWQPTQHADDYMLTSIKAINLKTDFQETTPLGCKRM